MKVRAASPATQALLQAAADGRLEEFLGEINDKKSTRRLLGWAHCSSGCKALHWAAGNGHVRTVDFLLQITHSDDDDDHDDTPFFDVNCPAVGKSQGRTALHYAARNGHLPVVQKLVQHYQAHPNVKARHGVTPLQLAVWQGRLDIAQYLVEETVDDDGRGVVVDPHQTNDFDCGLVHWMGLAPRDAPVVDMAKWLHQNVQLPMHVVQRQGHSALHKAAWGGHLELCRYLHETVGMWDDAPDAAGNYAVDLARMAQHEVALVDYLQRVASRTTLYACQVLGVSLVVHERTVALIQRAFREAARTCHPDGKERRRRIASSKMSETEFELNEEQLVERFQMLTHSYRHLMACATMDEDNEKLLQDHASHELPRLLTADGSNPSTVNEDCFEARLLQVIGQNRHGLDLSNLVKKWKQVWPGVNFPTRTHASLQQWLRQEASHVVTIRADDQGVLRLYPQRQST